jgi:hypothetical protein
MDHFEFRIMGKLKQTQTYVTKYISKILTE